MPYGDDDDDVVGRRMSGHLANALNVVIDLTL